MHQAARIQFQPRGGFGCPFPVLRESRDSPVRLVFEFREPVCLIFRDECVNDLSQVVARENALKLVQREIDAVIGHAALGEIVGADALGTIS